MADKSVRYTPEFKRQMSELVRTGRTPASLAKEHANRRVRAREARLRADGLHFGIGDMARGAVKQASNSVLLGRNLLKAYACTPSGPFGWAAPRLLAALFMLGARGEFALMLGLLALRALLGPCLDLRFRCDRAHRKLARCAEILSGSTSDLPLSHGVRTLSSKLQMEPERAESRLWFATLSGGLGFNHD